MPLCPSRVFTHLYVVKVSHTLKKQEQETPSEEKINLKHFNQVLTDVRNCYFERLKPKQRKFLELEFDIFHDAGYINNVLNTFRITGTLVKKKRGLLHIHMCFAAK